MIFSHPGTFCVLVGGALGLILTAVTIRFAKRWGLVDLPSVRKVHTDPVSRIGGVAIALAAITPVFLVALLSGRLIGPATNGPVITLIASSLCVLLFGLVDDLVGVPAKYKLLVLLVASATVCGSGGVIRSLTFDGHAVLQFGDAAWPITMLWMVGVTVGINFIDGLDGLAAGIVATSCVVLAASAEWCGHPMLALLPQALLGVPSDSSYSTSIPPGFSWAIAEACSSAFSWREAARLPSSAWAQRAVCFSQPWLYPFRYLTRCSHLSDAESWSGGPSSRLNADIFIIDSWILACATAMSCCSYTGALFWRGGGADFAARQRLGDRCERRWILLRIAVSLPDRGHGSGHETIRAIRRNRALGREKRGNRIAFEELQIGFRNVRTFPLWWEHVCQAAGQLKFAKMDLPMVHRDGSTTTLKWRCDTNEIAEENSLTAEIPVPQRRVGQSLRIAVEVTVSGFLETAGQRLALFSRLIAECSPKELPEPPLALHDGDATDQEQMPDPQHAEIGPHDLTSSDGPFAGLRIAIVHDFLYTYAGAERVLEQLVALFPACDLFSIFDFLPADRRGFIQHKPVRSTFIQRMPLARRKHRAYLPLMPIAIEQLEVSPYDIVISSSYLVAKGVLTRPGQLHICYCHTPARFAWGLQNQYLNQVRGIFRFVKDGIVRVLLHYIRNWDVQSANNVDVFITNSNYVGRRIQKVYRRNAETIYPPVDTDWYSFQGEKEDYYVTASRLVPYKRIDLVVEAFGKMPDRRLIVIGEGPQMEEIRSMAGSNVRLLGYQPAARLKQYLQRARAFVFAAEEDFGIVPVEAQACGTPVICFGSGGVTESVVDGQTGVHFAEQTPESLIDAVHRFEAREWDLEKIRQNAERFSIRKFREHFAITTRDHWTAFLAKQTEDAAVARSRVNGSSTPAVIFSRGGSALG